MTFLEINTPMHLFNDLNGVPLENGYIYIGQENLNPETNPITTYWDKELTQPAAQPIRTISGYPSRYGTPSKIFIDGNFLNFSITVKNVKQKVVYYSKSTNSFQANNSLFFSVDTIESLELTPADYSTVIVSDENRGGVFTYDPTKSAINNGGTIFNGWVRQYSGSVNVKWFGFSTSNSALNNGTILNDVQLLFKEIEIPSGSFNVSRIIFQTGCSIFGENTTLVSNDLSSCFEFSNKNKIRLKGIKFNSQSANALVMNFNSGSYDLFFEDCEIQGNSNLNSQVGLGFLNTFIVTFNNCIINNLGINIRFGTQSNRIVFNGCSIRANQTNNIALIRVEGGVNNSFIGCDIENCGTWIDNGSISSIEEDASVNFTDCYLEASLNANTLKYGTFLFENSFISEPRFMYYSTTDSVSFINNTIRKKGQSYILYFMDNSPNDILIKNNYINYDTLNPTTTGLFYRGFDGGIQYVTNGNISSPTWGNATLGAVSINQTRVFDVNTSTIERYIVETSHTYNQFNGDIVTTGNIRATGSTAGMYLEGEQWNQGHFNMGGYHLWIYDGGTGNVQLRAKKGSPAFNTDGVVVATIG